MGIESFYINIVEQNALFSVFSENTYSGSRVKTTKEAEAFLRAAKINTSLLRITMFSEKDYLQGFSLEGCFSCYEEALKQIFNFINYADKHFIKVKICLFNKEFCKISDTEKIKEYLDESFSKKRKSFSDEYGVSFLSKPGNAFYRKYRFFKFFNLTKFKK